MDYRTYHKKTHESRLEYEIKYDLYKIGRKIKKPKMCTLEDFKAFLNLKKSRFFRSHFPTREKPELCYLCGLRLSPAAQQRAV